MNEKKSKLETTIAKTISNETPDYEKNADFQILHIQKTLNTINLKNEKIRFLPSLGVFYSGGLNYGTNSFGDVVKFGDYRKYNIVGATLNVPIFSSGQKKFRVDQAKIELEKIENNMNPKNFNIFL